MKSTLLLAFVDHPNLLLLIRFFSSYLEGADHSLVGLLEFNWPFGFSISESLFWFEYNVF